MKKLTKQKMGVITAVFLILIITITATGATSLYRPPIATYPPNQDYGQQGDFIGKRAVDAGRSAIMSTIGPVLILLPETPGSSDAHVTLQNWDSSWNLSNLLDPQFIRYVNCFEGVCRNGHAQHAHATHTNFWDGEAYLWTNNYWQLGNSHTYNPETGDTETETPFWQAYAGRLYSPFYMSDFWSYSAPFDSSHTIYYTHESGSDWRGRPIATWDHLGLTGVTGFFSFHGDLLVVASDQASTGMAIYSMNGWQAGIDSDDFVPQLLSVFQPTLTQPDDSTVGLGGYWAEPYGANKMVWAARNNNEVGRTYPAMYVADFTDPLNPRMTCELYFNQDNSTTIDGDNMTHPMYVNFQDQYAYVDNMKIDIDACEAAYLAGKDSNPDYFIDTAEMAAIVTHFETHQNHCDGSQYFRPLGQVGVFGGVDRFGTEAIITYDGPPMIEGQYTSGGYTAHNFSANRTLIGNPNIQVGDTIGGRTVTSVEIDDRVNTQGICFFVTSDEPDTNPPYVSGHRPLADATNVAVDTFISIHIPETVRTETAVSPFTLTRTDTDQTVSFQHRLTHTGTFTLWPDEDLEIDVTYRVDVAGIQDYMGNEMAPYSFNFTTGETLVVPPPTAQGWVHCANEDEPCELPITTVVRYGANGNYEYIEDATGTIDCNDATFGDPASGTTNTCQYWTGPDAPDFDGTPYYPNQSSQLSCLPESETNNLWAVNPDNHTVAIIDTYLEPGSQYVMLNGQQEIDLGYRKPTSITRIGAQYAVTYQASDVVAFIDAANGELAFAIETGYGTQPTASVTNGTSLFVALFGSGEVIEIDPTSQTITERLDVGTMPKAMALDGDRLLVTRFISPLTHAEVYDVDTSAGLSLTRTILINKVLVNDSLDHGAGVPNFLSSIVIDATGERGFVTAVKANTDRGTSSISTGLPLDDDNTIRPMLIEIDLVNNQDANTDPNTPEGTIDFDNAADPAGVTYLVDGESRIVTFQGNNVVAAQNETLSSFTQFSSGFAPQQMCTTLRALYVKNFTDRTVSAIDVAGYMADGNRNPNILSINTVETETLTAEELLGLQHFYQSSIPAMGPEGYMSCASCHSDGGQDGMVWDLTSLGEGLRNTISLNGTSGTRFGDLHWSGNFDEVQDFELQMEQLNGGDGLVAGITFHNDDSPMTLQMTGQSADLDALAAYVASLGKDTVSHSPYRTFDGELTEAAERGQQLFTSIGCAECHSGAAFRDGQLHDVGTISETSGNRLGEALTAIRTPTLVELWLSAPYFHDGSAATLNDVLDVGTHAVPLTPEEEADLIQFLLSIDQAMFIDDDAPFPEGLLYELMLPLLYNGSE